MFVRRGLFRPAQPTGTSDGLHQRSARSKKAEAKETWLLCKGPEVQPRHCGKWSSTRILLTGCSGTNDRSSSFFTWIWRWIQMHQREQDQRTKHAGNKLWGSLGCTSCSNETQKVVYRIACETWRPLCRIQLVEHSIHIEKRLLHSVPFSIEIYWLHSIC